MLRLKTYFENDFDPESAGIAIQGIKSKEINGIPVAPPMREITVRRGGVLLERFLNDYIEELASGKKKKKGRTLRSNILRFESFLKTSLTLEDINMDFQREFVSYEICFRE